MREMSNGVNVGFRLRYRDESHYLTRSAQDDYNHRIIRFDDGRYEPQHSDCSDVPQRIEAVKEYRRQEYDRYVRWHQESDHALYTAILPFEE